MSLNLERINSENLEGAPDMVNQTSSIAARIIDITMPHNANRRPGMELREKNINKLP